MTVRWMHQGKAKHPTQMNEMQYSKARTELADLHEHALAHLPTRITRRRADAAVLLSESDFLDLLGSFEFHPDVIFEDGGTSIWLPELAIWGPGDSFASARDDRIDEVDQLLAVFEDDERLRNLGRGPRSARCRV